MRLILAVAQKGFWELRVGPAIVVVVGWQAAVTGRFLEICDNTIFLLSISKERQVLAVAQNGLWGGWGGQG